MGRLQVTAQQLMDTARSLVGGGKGLLAMDESNPPATSDLLRPESPRPRKPGAPIGN